MGNDLDSIEATLETLFNEPFMAITKGPPEYEIDSHDGPPGYEQVIVQLQINNIRPEVMTAFNADYDSLARNFAKWAKSKDFVDSQILGDEGTTLVFEITTISPD